MIEHIYKEFEKSYHVTIDSRKVKAGSIFFALKGENNDGNAYAANALQDGAALAENGGARCGRLRPASILRWPPGSQMDRPGCTEGVRKGMETDA